MKKMPFGEADFLVRILSRDFGKIDILAKGARKTASKLNAHIDILNHIRVSFVKNGERLPTLTDAEILNRYDDWFSDSEHISVAGRILQTLDKIILPGSKDDELFSIALRFFAKPDTHEENAVKFLREIFKHEGHGDSLPPEHEQSIIKIWPILKN
ncbi:DNA repair protein RecO [Candidatus Giovannonibacteria bacterium RIFCSPHIGHO2_01_FULL_45_33]|uniref:DNA repair protein RecO n=1 Tax=Candidatus Giovannonibacteria bacterium RIFCSPLOWO2_01_FULL_45_34 TaxID=1798351 RepID=A0A1F5WZ27_9BACT|nr:MAG: DNA repair protein RecO [Candidatus Giovannonibacteria bacterium RIFCSPHIGHO2_01_FULL_45_33]OGF70149.1 MAG: DNA repair protein RecO [Candidatus Giovannonibacteria bacterium RIFCSPHIGHO2_02_FULL_44_11]OGF80877.1 MAG: DNA repair protein RecO [Candidatus Giovannonibacteria bacterium RIFCSPLOWO2_01_FULL_45_34]